MFDRADSSVIVLIGMMGAGKTTVGRVLANMLSVPAVDNDEVIAERGGLPAARQLRNDAGKFRALEAECIVSTLGREDAIVFSVGGGAPTTPTVQQALLAHAPVIWIRVPEDELFYRLQAEVKGRPMLDGNPRERLQQLLQERTPTYERVASLVVDGVGTPQVVAQRIVEALK